MVGQRKNWRSIIAAIVLIALLAPVRASFAGGSTFSNPKYKMLILTVAMLNKAMQDASQNPQDEWRRVNVQRAIGMLPPALIALAGEYQNGNLDGKDFQQAYKVVAAFVDVAAADGYKKFLKKPDRSLIPALPANFPKVDAPSVPGGLTGPSGSGGSGREHLAIDESRGTQSIAQVESPKNAALSNELVNLSAVRPASSSASSSQPAARESLGFDESASRDVPTSRVGDAPVSGAASSATSSASSAPQASSSWQPGSAAVREAQRDLSQIEQRVGSSDLTIRPSSDVVRAPSSLRSDVERDEKNGKVFDSVGKDGDRDAKDAGKKSRARRPKAGKKTSALETLRFWAVRLAEATILPGQAFAESGGGGEGGGGGEAAQLASAILFGAAEIIKAIAPMVVAKTQAEADKAIARINSDTQKYLTDQTANTSKYLADQQKDIAIFQSNLAASIAADQQKNVNYRLDRQLAELKDARLDAQNVQAQIRNKEWEYNERRLQIAEDQAQKNYELAQEALKAQLTASGLSSGFANSFDSGNQLTTSSSQTALGGVGGTGQQALTGGFQPIGQGASAAGTVASAGSVASAGGLGGGSAAGGASGLNLGLGQGASAAGLGATGGAASRGAMLGGGGLANVGKDEVGGTLLGAKNNKDAFSRLMDSVGRGAADEGEEEFEDAVSHKKDAKSAKRKKGTQSLRLLTKLTKDGKPVATTPIAKADGKSSDLIKFFGDRKPAGTFASETAAAAAAPQKPKAN